MRLPVMGIALALLYHLSKLTLEKLTLKKTNGVASLYETVL